MIQSFREAKFAQLFGGSPQSKLPRLYTSLYAERVKNVQGLFRQKNRVTLFIGLYNVGVFVSKGENFLPKSLFKLPA